MLRRVSLIRIDYSEENIASIIRVTSFGELGNGSAVLRLLVTANVVPSSPIFVTLMIVEIRSSETSVITRAKWCNRVLLLKFQLPHKFENNPIINSLFGRTGSYNKAPSFAVTY
jgi:hypothetical protein